jgi:hypothetical protein
MKKLTIIVCVFFVTIMSLASSYALDSQMICGIWLFDEGKGNVVEDSSGNGFSGELKGDIKWVKGKLGNALEFSGAAGNYVLIPHNDALSLKTFSITAWISLVSKNAYQALVEKGEVQGDVRNYYLAITDGNQLYGGFKDSAGWNSCIADNVADEKWHHVAVTYDFKKTLTYIDGKSFDKMTIGVTGGVDPLQNEAGVTIGVTNINGGEPAQGIIDEVGIFNNALTEDDVKAIMQKGLSQAALMVESSGKLASTWGIIKKH